MYVIDQYAKGKENALIEQYIEVGPTELKEDLGLTDQEWQVLFDYLVFEHNLLYKTVTYSSDFFVETYIKHGVSHIREILDITDKKYDAIWEVVFDFLAISKDGLYLHFLEHKERYLMLFKIKGGDALRRVLAISKEKYDECWTKILDVLLSTVCEQFFTEQTFEQSLRSFVYLLNGMRVHRAVVGMGVLRGDLV